MESLVPLFTQNKIVSFFRKGNSPLFSSIIIPSLATAASAASKLDTLSTLCSEDDTLPGPSESSDSNLMPLNDIFNLLDVDVAERNLGAECSAQGRVPEDTIISLDDVNIRVTALQTPMLLLSHSGKKGPSNSKTNDDNQLFVTTFLRVFVVVAWMCKQVFAVILLKE
jgi:hypothetical protein